MTRTIPLEAFAVLVGAPRESIRTAMKRGGAPIQREPKPEHATARRVYDLEDAIAWCAFEALRGAGLAPRPAARAVRASGIASAFARALQDDPARAHAMVVIWRRVRDPLADRVLDLVEIGEAATARQHLAAATVDRAFADREQLLSMCCIPVWPHWEAAMQRAAGLPVRWAELGLPEPPETTDA